MVFHHDRFKNHILPEQIHILNVAFLVPDMRREFGGCAGNIAYNLKLLGGDPLIMATVGDDAAPYICTASTARARCAPTCAMCRQLHRPGLHHHRPRRQPDHRLPPGRDDHSHLNKVADARGATLGIVAPDGRDGMLQHAREFKPPPAFPSSSIRARACRCSTATN
jgi:adenosine kinase